MSIQNNCVLNVRLSQAPANTDEDHYIAMPHAGEWKLDAAYFTPNAAVSTSGTSNLATLNVKQGSTAMVTSQIVKPSADGGTGDLVAGTTVAFAIPASSGASLELSQGDVMYVECAKTNSGYTVTGEWAFSFKQIVS